MISSKMPAVEATIFRNRSRCSGLVQQKDRIPVSRRAQVSHYGAGRLIPLLSKNCLTFRTSASPISWFPR